MSQKHVIFDLDGTLTDSGEGILNSVEMTLRHFTLPVPDRQALRVFVGPPLRDMFIAYGIPENRVEEAIDVYRSRYNTIGKFENSPYPGIPQLLGKLQNTGYHLYVATSKPEHTAIEILEKFQLAKYFEEICGGTPDGSRDEKSKVIAYLLSKLDCTGKTWMIGDTDFDVIGAAAHGIPTIGVSWGYGNIESMVNAGAAAIVHTSDELYEKLSSLF
ncbi:MAG: HAD hydrolase-like protein [Oscillospiraceae bacterium]|nr:HAD hydrolase-like protein [Oscillospiraceae bacterium]